MAAMYFAPLFYLLTTLTSLALTISVQHQQHQQQHAILATLPSTKCPCTLTVSIPHPLFTTRQQQKQPPPLDILVSAANQFNFVPDSSLSRYNYTTSRATARDALFSYHHLHIDTPSQIRVQVRQWRSPGTVEDDRAFISVLRQSKRCPIILGAPHETPASPTSPPEGTGQPNGEVPTIAPDTITQVRSRSSPERPLLRLPEEEPRSGKTRTTARDAASLQLKSERETQPRIVGGQAAKRKLANFLAYIKIPSPNGVRACSGTVIGRRLILTAAHCGTSTSSTVYVGARQGNPSDGTSIAVESVNNHELFTSVQSGHFRYDIALITLKDDVPNNIEFMKVNVNTSVPVEKSIVRAAGYGILSHQNQYSNPNAQLYHVDVPIVPRRTCMNAYGAEGVTIDYSYQVCAGYFGRGGCDSCQGDSGGPLFQYDTAGIPVIVGIVSIGVECANARFPGVYVRTSTHSEFLPKDGITRSYDAVAVFSDFVPVTVIRTETIILAATGGVIVLLAVLFLGFIAVSKWKRTSSSGVDPPEPPSSMHHQVALPPPPPPPHRHYHHHPHAPMSTTTSGMDGTSTTGSHVTHLHHGGTDDNGNMGWAAAQTGMTFQESQRLAAVHDGGGAIMAQLQQLRQHQMQGVPAHVLAAQGQFDNFDPYEQHDGGNGVGSRQVPLEVPGSALQQPGTEAAGMPAVQAQLEVYPSNADGIRLNETRPPQ